MSDKFRINFGIFLVIFFYFEAAAPTILRRPVTISKRSLLCFIEVSSRYLHLLVSSASLVCWSDEVFGLIQAALDLRVSCLSEDSGEVNCSRRQET